MNEPFDPYYTWLGISPKQRPLDYYGLLGLQQFELDPVILESAADQKMGHVRAFQVGPRGELAARILNELAAARVVLLNPEKKADYDQRLRSAQPQPAQPKAPLGQLAAPSIAVPGLAATNPPEALNAGRRFPLVGIAGGGIGTALLVALVVYLTRPDTSKAVVEPPTTAAMEPAPVEEKPPKIAEKPAQMETAVAKATPAGEASSTPVDLLSRVDLKRDTKQGRVYRQGNGLVIAEGKLTILNLSCELPPQYQIDMTVKRLSGTHVLGLALVIEGRHFEFNIDAAPRKKPFTGIGQLDGKATPDNPQSHRGVVLPKGMSCGLSLIVRSNSVRLLVDGAAVYEWQGDPQSVTLADSKLVDFGLFARRSAFEIQSMTIKPLGGSSHKAVAGGALLRSIESPSSSSTGDASPASDVKPANSPEPTAALTDSPKD